MKKSVVMTLLILTCQIVLAQQKITGYKPDIESYVGFIQSQHQSPVEYLLRKYETHDVIVLGERDHRDITQYYFFEKLINTEEFYSQVSAIYTEVGSSNYNDTLNKVLLNSSLTEAEAAQQLIGVFRDISYQAFWDKYNCFYLWKTVFAFNKSHPDFPITIEMTSYPFDWDEIADTATCRAKTDEVEENYDRFMAGYFLKSFEAKQNTKRNKAFVIMNYPHSLRKWTSQKNITYSDMFGGYINEKLGDRVCYIIVNPYTLNYLPVANGKWDAAFKYCSFPPIGFDFSNSPFGKDTFDVWPLKTGILSFEELYDGIIFINPASECENMVGIPGFIDRKFGKEYLRRLKLRMYAIQRDDFKTKYRWEKASCNTLRKRTVYDDIQYRYGDDGSKNFDTIVNSWLLF
ncbi:MAG: hypothetical protein CVU11_12470 [Bacteroidetes bacterium HGW-Bacteroidetes-6]|jgi:hypothetical protein|nr:MAG: hypothetical protein CVU11_12470 [Bacteroidetes bacterium HGW-Bacteroidetes-6]